MNLRINEPDRTVALSAVSRRASIRLRAAISSGIPICSARVPPRGGCPPEPQPKQIRSVNLIREFLGGPRQFEAHEPGFACSENQVQWDGPAFANTP